MENLTTIGQSQPVKSNNYEFVEKWHDDSLIAESKLTDNTVLSFENETDKSQTNSKIDEKQTDPLGLIPQNSIDAHSFHNYEPNNNFSYIEPKNETFDEADDTDYEYMG